MTCTCTGLGLRVLLARLTGRPLEHRPDCPTRRPRFHAGGIVTRGLVVRLDTDCPAAIIRADRIPAELRRNEYVLPPYARGGAVQ